MLEFADAVPLIPEVDGVIVVADAGATRRSELVELNELLTSAHARVIGSVLNRDGSRIVSRRARRARQRMASDRQWRQGRHQARTRSTVPPSHNESATGDPTGRSGSGNAYGDASRAAMSGWPVEAGPSTSQATDRSRRRA
jgi:hypothetical protein